MSNIVLIAPERVAPVASTQAAGLVPIDETVHSKLAEMANLFINELVAIDAKSPAFGAKVDQLTNLGHREFLRWPTKTMDGEGSVSSSLIELRRVVEDLDPNRTGNLLEPRELFGVIPFGSKLKAYFDRYVPAQAAINGILTSLTRGKDELLHDNITINTERAKMWEMMGRLEQMIQIARLLDDRLERSANHHDAVDPTKALALREGPLFYVRQRTNDLLTQMAVSVQGYLALDLIRKNNIELIKGVDRASTTTIVALRTAVTVAQALSSQKLVLDQIAALNTTTANMIEATGDLIKNNTTGIQEQAVSAMVSVDTLQRAFANIYETMDAVDQFKVQAL